MPTADGLQPTACSRPTAALQPTAYSRRPLVAICGSCELRGCVVSLQALAAKLPGRPSDEAIVSRCFRCLSSNLLSPLFSPLISVLQTPELKLKISAWVILH